MSLETQTVTIASGTSLSAATATGAESICGIAFPAAWDAAVLTFQVSVDGANWLNLYDITGAEISVTGAAGQYLQIDPVVFAAVNLVKVRSGTGGVAVNQSANRILTLVRRVV